MNMIYALDIGGSSMKHALVEPTAPRPRVIETFAPVKLHSNRFEELKSSVIASVRAVLAEHRNLATIGISTTGTVAHDGTVMRAGHFEDYANVSWDHILRVRFPQLTHVVTANDGKASAWAEFVASGSGESTFVHFVVGTGIGGGIVVFKQPIYGSTGHAGYVGHIKVTDDQTRVCSCTRRGCVETVAAAPAIVRAYCGDTALASLRLEDVAAAARGGDAAAISAFERAGEWLGTAMGALINILNPGIVTIGGGVVVAADGIAGAGKNIFIEAARAGAGSVAHPGALLNTTISAAQFGNDGGLLGAAMIASVRGFR
jgi:glucokinase